MAPQEMAFSWGSKVLRDLIRYLYGNSETTYSKLVIAVCQVESEMEETKERVKARSAASTEVVSGSKELGDQIARLMAALTRVEQGSHPASAHNSPRHRGHGRGQVDRNTPICPSSHNGQTGLVKLLPFGVPQLQTEKALILNEGGIYGCRMVHRVVLRAQGTPTCCNASDARVGVTWQGSVPL